VRGSILQTEMQGDGVAPGGSVERDCCGMRGFSHARAGCPQSG